mgnify:CR=1 FL=1
MDQNLAYAAQKFEQWLHLFHHNGEDARLKELHKEITELHYDIVDSNNPQFVKEDNEFQYLYMEFIGLIDFRGEIVLHAPGVLFRVPKNYTPDISGVLETPSANTAPAPLDTLFTSENLDWLVTTRGGTTRWSLPEDSALIAKAKNLEAKE